MNGFASIPEPIIVPHAQPPGTPPEEAARFLLPEQIQWKPLVPSMGENSPRLSVIHHVPQTGATTMLIWTPPGFHVPRHWHSGTEKHMVVKGVFIIECEGQRVTMTPGTFNLLPARTIHQAWTPPESDCLLYTDVDRLWDINWLDGPAGPA